MTKPGELRVIVLVAFAAIVVPAVINDVTGVTHWRGFAVAAAVDIVIGAAAMWWVRRARRNRSDDEH